MESMATISELDWSSINGVYTDDEAEFVAQFMGLPSSFWPTHDANEISSNFYLGDSNSIMEMDAGNSYLIEGDEFGLNQNVVKNENLSKVLDPVMEVDNNPSGKSKKRNRNMKDVEKNKSVVKIRKNKKLGSISMNDEDNNVKYNGQTSSSCSEDDSNVSLELNGGVCSSLSSKEPVTVKTRASRGSATDPQSLYARKRREKINGRLRILQGLIPNGTKVDISTMLEEAVQYVKFLQVQIKLLSSDDLWMYAPIAYNGRDIGLDLKIAMTINS